MYTHKVNVLVHVLLFVESLPLQESLTAVMEVIELGVSGTVSSVSLLV